MGTITHVATTERVAALTFDDGPHPDYTLRLVEILERHGACGTFFMIGQQAQRYPETVRRVAQGGHAIGNHTWDHQVMPAIDSRQRRAQLRACARALAPYGQPIFRPPYGSQSRGSRFDTLRTGHQVVTWNVHVEDWVDHPAAWMADRLAHQITPGSIVLLHDTLWQPRVPRAADRSSMLDAVAMLLERRSGQFRFVTVPELLRCGRPVRQNWYQRSE